MGMKITYLAHSGFAVELEQCVLLFDYYQGEWPSWERQKPVYVFVSHKHQDHFQLKIFDLLSQCEKVHYFLSSDIKLNAKYLERKDIPACAAEHMTAVHKNAELSRDMLSVRSLRSTDEGVAFLVEAEGKRIYHAGDLNWWHWEEETEDWNNRQRVDYQREIDKLSGMIIDAAFVVLDPRLGEAYRLGIDYFMKKTDTKYLFPMHVWEQYECIERYRNSRESAEWADRTAAVTRRGQTFLL